MFKIILVRVSNLNQQARKRTECAPNVSKIFSLLSRVIPFNNISGSIRALPPKSLRCTRNP